MTTASSMRLQELHPLISTHIAALEALNQPVEHWDAWLVTIALRKLDQATIQAWQSRCGDTELPKYTDLEKFLARRCIAFETTETWSRDEEVDREGTTSRKGAGGTGHTKKALIASNYTTVDKTECPCCQQEHKVYACKTFKELPQKEHLDVIRTARLCFNCLSPYHMVTACRSTYVCSYCKGKHNSLLHVDKSNHVEKREQNNSDILPVLQTSSPSSSNNQQPQVHSCIAAKSINSHVFLSTAEVLVTDCYGSKRHCRAVLDSGSMVNFISKGLLNILQLSTRRTQLPVGGIRLSQVQSVAMVEIQISSKTRKYELTLPCHVLPTIVSELPQCAVPKNGWNILDELRAELADPNFYKAGSVDLLIGAGAFYELLEADKVSLGFGNLGLQAIKFGWIVTGELVATCLIGLNSLGRSLEDDWKVNLADKDSYGQSSKANQVCKEEEETLQHFHSSYKRDEDGRFVLRLPIKTDVKLLGASMKIAATRFIIIERRLQQDETLRIQYTKFMNEYIEMGHMREVIKNNVSQHACYLPHHPVLKLSSLTTKLRVVFDASARTSSGVSLNDILRRGPVVQEDIFAILARFRKHQVVITADIEKMFRQILVAEEDTHLQRILWRPDPSKALLEYTLATVTYGTTPASFMATQCLVVLADNVKRTHPRASEVIKRDFYMDDLMTGGESEEECAQLQKEVTAILESAKLPLRKRCSNSSSLIAGITKNQNDALFTLDLGDEDIIKSLGLCWQPGADQFKFNVTASPEQTKLTKRKLLSDLNKVFDPLGFLGPVLIRGKIFLQQLWQLKLGWDEQLEHGIQERWKAYYGGLQFLGELAIPRKCKPNTSETVQVHGFSDASMEAYGACIYIRSLDQQGKWHGRLLCSRTRVAPLKGATIPRMELSGALLLVQLAAKVAESWNIELESFHLWTDSMITLGWLNCHSSRLKTFVANRVGQILEQTKVQ